jgi:hypothetical protein
MWPQKIMSFKATKGRKTKKNQNNIQSVSNQLGAI